jgi:Uma2 family endonuclease
MSQLPQVRYVVDPNHPRAPPQRVWDAMGADERARVLRELPVRLPEHLLPPPQGDEHTEATMEGRESLRAFFSRANLQVYVSGEMAVYYPDEKPFSPDLFAVLDVPTHKRNTWMVSEEGRGLDWVLEVLVLGDRRKDLDQNVLRYARLGVTEYFIFEPLARRLRGYRLTAPGVAMYESLASFDGVFVSRVLGLDLVALPNGKLRFRCGDNDLLVPQEIIERLETWTDEAVAAAEESALQAEEERQRAASAERATATERERALRAVSMVEEMRRQAEELREQAKALREQAKALREQAEAEGQRAEAERRRAEAERQRAEAERQRAEAAQQRAEAADRALTELRAKGSRKKRR